LDAQPISEKVLNIYLADHLLDLPPQDPLRENETMFHLIGAGDLPRAAKYYSAASLADSANKAATGTLASAVLTSANQSAAVEGIARLLDVTALDFESARRLAELFQSKLMGALRDHAQLEATALLAARIKEKFEGL